MHKLKDSQLDFEAKMETKFESEKFLRDENSALNDKIQGKDEVIKQLTNNLLAASQE